MGRSSQRKKRRVGKAHPGQKGGGSGSQARTFAFGLGGDPGQLTVVNVFGDPQDPRNVGGPGGMPGPYRATFTLARPGRPLTPEYQYTFESGLSGDSHLAIAKPAYSPPGNAEANQVRGRGLQDGVPYEWIGLPNERGFLGKIKLNPFHALSFLDAGRKAQRMVAPTLSTWSAHLDIPLHVAQVELREERTGHSQLGFRNYFAEVPLAVVAEASLDPQYMSAVSLYREGLESSSLVYRYLCFFKIIEGVRSLRVRRGREAKKSGATLSRPIEVVPEDEGEFQSWLNGIFAPRPERWDDLTVASVFVPDARGRSFEELVGEGDRGQQGGVLRALRNDIAHALWDRGGGPALTMSADDSFHHDRVHGWLPLCRCIARYMLKHEFPTQFLRHLRDDGTVVVGT
jgi:hypothetical protein